MLNRKVRALLIADITWFFGEGMLGPLFAIFAQRVGGNVLDISWAWAAYLIFAGLFIVFIGKISDKGGNRRRELVLAGYILNAALTFCYLFVNNIVGLLLVQIGLGIAAALATPTWDALYSEYQRKEERGFAWGMADGVSEIFTGIALIIGGAIVVYLSFNTLFLIMGFIQIVSIVLLLPALERDMAKEGRKLGRGKKKQEKG
jgi:MFS family permease